MSRFWQGHKGYSLVEAMTVISILSIMTIIALPNYIQWRSSAQYKEAALGMSNHMREARARAISGNVEYRVTFDMDPGRYQMERGDRSYSSSSWSQSGGWVNLPGEVSMASGTDCDVTSDVQVTFTPNGACNATQTLCVLMPNGAAKYKVRIVSAASGRVVVE